MTADRHDDERDRDVRAAYRRAAETLDERPDARVRARVLAAATAAARSAPPGTRRWPVQAAAVVVVSVMAGLLVAHVARDEPERVTIADNTTVAGATPSPAAAPRAEAGVPPIAVADATIAVRRPAAPPSQQRAKATEPAAANEAAAKESAPTAPRGARAIAAPSDGSAFPKEPQRRRESPPIAEPPPAPAPAAPSPDPAASRTDPTSPVEQRSVDRVAPDVQFDIRPEAPAVARPSRDVAPMALAARGAPEPATPDAWVERIVALRAAGRAAEADVALATLRRRYPDFVVPPAALGATGTR